MKTMLLMLLGAGCLLAQELPQANAQTAAEPLLFVIEKPMPTPAQEVVRALEEGMNAAMWDDVARMKNLWETVWENPRATPAEVLAEWGPDAAKAFRLGALARAHLEAIAEEAGTTAEVLLGDSKYLTPKLPVNINHETGFVTLQ